MTTPAPRPKAFTSERVAVVLLAVALLIFSNGPVFLVSHRLLDRVGTWEEPFIQASFVAAAVAMATLLLARAAQRAIAAPSIALPFAVGFTVVAVASVRWSLAPDLTRWRSWIYVGMLAGAWALSTLDLHRFRHVLTAFTCVALVASLAAVAFRPDIGVDDFGSWRGLYLSPNSLAPVAGIGTILSIERVIATRQRARIAAIAALVGSGLLLVASQSATAIVGTVAATAGAGCLIAIRRTAMRGDRSTSKKITAGALLAGSAAVVVLGPALWRTDNFLLRRELWGHLGDRIAARPTTGYGFFVFWDIPSVLVPRLLVRAGSAHNSFVEVLLGVGLVGLAFFVPVMLLSIAQPVRDLWRHPDRSAFVWLSVALLVFLSNLTESFVLWFSYMWVLAMASAFRRPRPSGVSP